MTRIENNRFFSGISKLPNFNNLCSDFLWTIYDLCYAPLTTNPNSTKVLMHTVQNPFSAMTSVSPRPVVSRGFLNKKTGVSIDSSVVHYGVLELRLKLCRSRFKYQLCHVFGHTDLVSLNLSFPVCHQEVTKVTVVGILEDCGEDSMRGTSEVLTDCLPHGKWMPVLSLC